MAFHIREFRPEDSERVAALVLPIQNVEFGVPVTREEQPDLLDIEGFFFADGGCFWVAVEEGEVIGTLGAKVIGDGRIVLRKMFVAAHRRGREHGVAARLLDVLLGWARAGGMREALLGTHQVLRAAQRFYEKNGFVAVPVEELPPSFPRMAVDDRFYRLTL